MNVIAYDEIDKSRNTIYDFYMDTLQIARLRAKTVRPAATTRGVPHLHHNVVVVVVLHATLLYHACVAQ